MSKPNADPLHRTHDAGLNAARGLLKDPDAIVLAAVMMNRGLLSFKEIQEMVMRERAIAPPQ